MMKSRRLALSMIGAAAALLLYCGSFFVKSYLENLQARQAYENLREICLPRDETFLENSYPDKEQEGSLLDKADEKRTDTSGDTAVRRVRSQAEQKIKESFGINWEKLRKVNPQTIAWITVPGADISYPVVQGEDDEYYLHHSIDGKEDAFGTIFLGCGNHKKFGDSHSSLYGHNMEGNMMFANLNRYEEKEFLGECPVFYIFTPEQMLCYEIFSVQQADEQSPGFQYGYALGSKAYKTQLRMLAEGSMYPTGVSADPEKPITTLVTCNSRLDEHIRMTIHGTCREVREWKE